ncbi:MAG: hypothetical protein ACI8Y4_003788 [Candidatus Poriferisodalaceae bacterium]|jgi:hypothetical protein
MATTGEPEDLAAQEACGSPPPDATVWYSLTVDETLRVLLSSVPPTYSSGFNVVVEGPGGFECVGGGPVEINFLADPGTTYLIQ